MKIDGISKLWQWDTGRKLIVEDDDCARVDYTQDGNRDTFMVLPHEGIADIPNILLQRTGTIHAYICHQNDDGSTTVSRHDLVINDRKKPADYVYTETEVYVWEDFERRVFHRFDDVMAAAEGYASDAQAAKTVAEKASGNARAYSLDAKTSKGYAEDAERAAKSAQNDAESARNVAETARDAAVSARDSAQAYRDSAALNAENARTASADARDYSDIASGYATTAKNYADTAKEAAEMASDDALWAQTYKNDANASADDAKGYADNASADADRAEEAAEAAERSASDIPALKVNDQRQDGDIANIKAMLNGYLYRPVTQSGMLRYVNIPANVMPWASVDKADAVTVTMNQQVNRITWSPASSSYYTRSVVDGVVSVKTTRNGSATNSGTYSGTNAVEGHLYFISAEIKSEHQCQINIRSNPENYSRTTEYTGVDWERISLYTQATSGAGALLFVRFAGAFSSEDEYMVRNAFAVDLTQMFGSGNEPDEDACKIIFASSPIPYDASGTAITVKPTAIVSRDAEGMIVESYTVPVGAVHGISGGSIEFLTDADTDYVHFPVDASATYLIDLREAINDT